VKRSASAESLNAVSLFAVVVAVIPLLLKRGGGLRPTGYLKAFFLFAFAVLCRVVSCRGRAPLFTTRALKTLQIAPPKPYKTRAQNFTNRGFSYTKTHKFSP
jgi:hypothetical protein